MDPSVIGYSGLVIMILLIVIGVPIAFALASVGIVGTFLVVGFNQTLSQAGLVFFHEGTNFGLIAVPMFVLMGTLANHTGIAAGLFKATANTLGRLPGGLAMAAVAGSGGFGAISGSSTATVITMGRIVMPEFKKYNYDVQLGAGVLSVSGTLGILIPPSLVLIFYGIMTENSIASLFIAGIFPGILTIVLLCLTILGIAAAFPNTAPRLPSPSRSETLTSLLGAMPVLILFTFIMGGIYLGVFTPTEASGIAVLGVLIYGIVSRRLTMTVLKTSLTETITTSTMIFAIVVAGYIVSRFVTATGITRDLIEFVDSLNLGPFEFMIVITIIYLILGCALDVLAMIILTVPFVYPIILHLGFDPIWFGIYVVVMAEIALVTPPLGLNIFVMRAIAPDVPLTKIYKGVLPFVVVELVIVALLVAFPQIALWPVPS